MDKCRSYGPDKLNFWPFYHLAFKYDFDLQPTWINVSNDTALLKENNCVQLISNVEVMAQTSSVYDHFIIWSSSVTLTFNLSEQIFKMALLLLKENIYTKLFWNPCINVEGMAQINPDARTHPQRTHIRTHILRAEVVTYIFAYILDH